MEPSEAWLHLTANLKFYDAAAQSLRKTSQRAFVQRGLQQLIQKVASLPDEFGIIGKGGGGI